MKKILFPILLLVSVVLSAQKEDEKEEVKPIPKAKSFMTKHQGVFGGKTINYTTTAKETYLTNKEGDSVATFWSVAYTKNPMGDVGKRPVTFVFNGGPGSASMWLHLGFFGPKVVKTDSDAKQDDGAAPYNLVHNEHGLLDLTDLVFIDPVGTGFSRLVGKGKSEDFYGLKKRALVFPKILGRGKLRNNTCRSLGKGLRRLWTKHGTQRHDIDFTGTRLCWVHFGTPQHNFLRDLFT
jgi:carboxypeptidase C (cathepsin A)